MAACRDRLNSRFAECVQALSKTPGVIKLLGMGKSGVIARKIASTMASTGTPAFFVHPAEAFHGDLGQIGVGDSVVLISYSGETEEVIRILPYLKHQGNLIVGMTGGLDSSLSRAADFVLDIGVRREACHINLAPTSSTTVTLVAGDALAVALARLRDFKERDFARFHPGGALGRKLLLRVSDVMIREPLPMVSPAAGFSEVVESMNIGAVGVALVCGPSRELVGVVTDGDIRRALCGGLDLGQLKAEDLMSRSPVTIHPAVSFADAEEVMRTKKIKALVVAEDGIAVGVINIFDVDPKLGRFRA
ncbi:MAG: SIS domain-containing protein [Oligoflexia bacterium]